MSDSSYPTVIYAETNNPFDVGRILGLKLAELQEKRIKDAIVGSKVTKIEYNVVPNEDDIYELVIGFDAQRIPLLEFSQGFTYENYAIGIRESLTHFIELRELRLKTTSREPFNVSDLSPTSVMEPDIGVPSPEVGNKDVTSGEPQPTGNSITVKEENEK